MLRSAGHAHLVEVFGWQRSEPVGWRAIAVGALGMVVPVLVGLACGRAEIGFTIGLGAMLLASGTGPTDAGTEPDRASPGTAVAPAVLAVVAATLIAGHAWSDVAMVASVTAAAAISGYSRSVGVAAIRFLIYLVLSLGVLESAGDHRGGAALVFGLGALWNVAVRTMLARRGTAAIAVSTTAAAAKPSPTHTQLRAHWRRTMREPFGWQFPIRLAVGLTIASAVRAAWPSHHYGWTVLTVALLSQRALEHVPIKLTQRTLGTVLGVGATWAIFTGVTSTIGLAVLICLLAVAAPIARARSYLAYASIATPAILLVLDMAKPIDTGLLVDRLVATCVGAAIVLVANLAADRWIPKPAARPTRRKPPGDHVDGAKS